VPSYAQGTINRFDTQSMSWQESYEIQVAPLGSEVPYAVYVDQKTDHVWITGTQSDTIIRFAPDSERWSVYPLPTLVNYTRELDMDAQGNVWTSHSSSPAWHVEGGVPKITRLNPTGAPDIEGSGLFNGMQPARPEGRPTVSLGD
jgi:virginiamycin B lyase